MQPWSDIAANDTIDRICFIRLPAVRIDSIITLTIVRQNWRVIVIIICTMSIPIRTLHIDSWLGVIRTSRVGPVRIIETTSS